MPAIGEPVSPGLGIAARRDDDRDRCLRRDEIRVSPRSPVAAAMQHGEEVAVDERDQ